jgi:hypothetical protein
MIQKTRVSPATSRPKPKLDNFGRTKLAFRSPTLLITILVVLGVLGLYLYRLNGLIPAGSGELHTIQTAASLGGLISNPLLLPFKFLAFIMLQLPIDNLLAVRLAAVSITCLNGILFFILAERWCGLLNGSLATLLFVTSGGILQPGRYGAGLGSLVLVTLLFLNLVVWTNQTERHDQVLAGYALSCVIALFIPGGIWLILVASWLSRKALVGHLRGASARATVIASLIGAVGVVLLGTFLLRNSELLRQWLGLPSNWPDTVIIFKQALSSVTAFVLRGPYMPEIWLAHTPILDVASTVLLAIGLLFYSHHLRNPRTQLLLLFFLLGAALVALNGPVALGYILPIVYLIIAGGLSYFLHQWKRVFPTNPIARATALSLIGILTLCIVTFHAERYFIAWRNSPATEQTYRQISQGKPSPNPLPDLVQ